MKREEFIKIQKQFLVDFENFCREHKTEFNFPEEMDLVDWEEQFELFKDSI